MKAFFAFVLLCCSASVCLADNDRGLYVGAGVGVFNIKARDITDVQALTTEFDSDDTSFKVFGGWRFNRYIAAELDYNDFGKPDDDLNGVPVSAEISGFAPILVGTLPLGPLELFAKVGYLFYDLKVEAGGQKIGSVSGNDEDLIYSAGLGLTLLGHLNARLAYERIDVSEVDDADAVWLTGEWRF